MSKNKLVNFLNGLKQTSFMEAVNNLFESALELKDRENPNPPNVFIAGGASVHYWIRSRFTKDVDAEFIGRVIKKGNSETYVDENGKKQTVVFDPNFAIPISFLHENYQDDAVNINHLFKKKPKLNIHILSPTHLAISKLSRFGDKDRADIALLSGLGFIDVVEFEKLATESLDYNVCNKAMVLYNIQDAVKMIKENSPEPEPEEQLNKTKKRLKP